MPAPRGFARGDFDTSFPLDDRFQELAVILPRSAYLQAVGAYWLVIASAWREASRKPVERVVVGVPDRIVQAMVAVGLLGEDHLLCETSFDRWVGGALGRRRKDADRNRPDTTPDESEGIQGNPTESVLARARPRTDRTGQVGTSQDTTKRGARATPRQQVLAWLTEHGASAPVGWVIGSLNEMVKVYGAETIIALWSSAPSDVRTSKQFVQYAERNLSPGVHGKTKGLGPTDQEANDAFNG